MLLRPGDRQVMQGLYEVYSRGQTHFQIGDNTNLFDWSYVENVAYAHLLAADKLVDPGPERDPLDPLALSAEEVDMLDKYLPPVRLSTGHHRIPTSEGRPPGPVLQQSPENSRVAQNFYDPLFQHQPRPIVRTKFDALSETALSRAKTSPLQVAGQVFFITNGEPVYFWDFTRYVWNELDKIVDPEGKERRLEKRRIVFPQSLGYVFASLAEFWGWLRGKPHMFTRFRVAYSCGVRWHNIEKARRVLGYEPQVGVEEGIKRMIAVRHVFRLPKLSKD
jgi:sterol-4alpha-carboxylate 3-dehydrogenase (decarboxylating)